MHEVRRPHRIAAWLARIVATQLGLAVACTGKIDSDPNIDSVEDTDPVAVLPADPQAPVPPRADAGAPAGSGGAGTAGSANVMLPDGSSGVGGAGGASGAGSVAEPVCDAVTQVLLPNCGGGSCHSNPDARIGDWAVGRAEAESFVDVPSVRNVQCGVIIDSSDPSQSLLLRKLIGDFPIPMCGGPMPVSGPDLTDAQISCMASWLEQFRR